MAKTDLLERVEGFLASKGETATAFGKRIANDPHLVFDMREGRRLWPETMQRVEAAIVPEEGKQHAKRNPSKSQPVHPVRLQKRR